jgi:hypothetical protein
MFFFKKEILFFEFRKSENFNFFYFCKNDSFLLKFCNYSNLKLEFLIDFLLAIS